MTSRNLRRAATLFGVVIPALAAAMDGKTLNKEEAVDACVEMREAFECESRSSDAMIDLRLKRRAGRSAPPSGQRLRAIRAAGSRRGWIGPRPPRAPQSARR